MAKTVRLQQLAAIKSNITSSLDVSPSQTYFAAVTRQQSAQSSMFQYSLDLYDLAKRQMLNKTQIYNSYSQQKHFCRFLMDDKTIVVTTKYHIIFYDTEDGQINQKFKALHELENIYDLTVSPNGRLVAIVGDNKLLFWDAITYRTIKFDPELPQARICRFSPDSTRFIVSFTENDLGTINIYSILIDEGQFFFELTDKTTIDISFGFISSVQFNPQINTQLVIGFSNISPRIFDLANPLAGYKSLYNIDGNPIEQPAYRDNYKQAIFLPDGKRVISSDYKEGVGLWPGDPDGELIYKEDYFFFGAIPYDKGRKVIGFVWQNIKIIQIQFKCPEDTLQFKQGNQRYRTSCSCSDGFYWDTAEYSCKSCNQNGFNKCVCPLKDEVFRNQMSTCVFDCSKVQFAVSNKDVLVPLNQGARCFCQPGYFWQNGRCVFDCFQISSYTINSNGPSSCLCNNPLQWNNISKTCQCPSDTVFNRNASPECECDLYHYRNPVTGRCVPDCTRPQVNADTLISFQETDSCPCRPGMIFKRYELPGSGIVSQGCIQNCQAIKYTIEGTPRQGCQCPQNMIWNGTSCRVDCSKINNAIGQIIDPQTGQITCRCPTNYLWVPQNLECGKDCSQVSYVNQSQFSTAISCPCINTFEWNQRVNQCVIDCEKINFTQSYSIQNTYSCVCRETFYWDSQNYQCVINCSKIWDALPDRVGPGQCKCNNDRQFNSTGLLCQNEDDAQQVFSKPWVWAVLVIGVIFIIVVFILMLRNCKKFASERNKEHDKKLKKSPQKKKKKRMKPKDNAATTSERMSLNR